MPIFCWKPPRWLPVSDQKPKPSQRASRCTRAPIHPSSLTPPVLAQVSPATLQGLDLALPPWNAFHPRYPKALMSSKLPSFKSLLKCYFFQGGLPTSFQMEAPCPLAFPLSLLCFMCFHCTSQPANLFFKIFNIKNLFH